MPPKFRKSNLEKARAALTEETSEVSLKAALSETKNQLQEALLQNGDLAERLAEKTKAFDHLTNVLRNLEAKCLNLSLHLDSAQEKQKELYHELRIQRQTTKRGLEKKQTLEKQILLLKSADKKQFNAIVEESKGSKMAINSLLKVNEHLRSELSETMTTWAIKLERVKINLQLTGSKLKNSQKELTQFKRAGSHAKERHERSVMAAREKALQEKSIHRLMSKGVFTEETRNMVRILVKAGCSRNYVNDVISAVLNSAGIKVADSISRPSIERIIREGFFAAQIQLGYEMKTAESMTFSADGTSHRSINYNARHVNLKAEVYGSGSQEKQQTTRFFGINSTRDGSSEEAIADWQKLLQSIVDIYNRSPFGKRTGGFLRIIDLLVKLAGMHSDHCAKEKKDAHLMEALKGAAIDQVLGEEAMLDKTTSEIQEIFDKGEKAMIKKAGGKSKWSALTDHGRAERRAVMVESLVAELGKEAFDLLSDEEKRVLKLFIWAGCGCHKDLNTVRGGYTYMAAWWAENGIDGPVLLANRDNSPVLDEREAHIAQGDTTTPA